MFLWFRVIPTIFLKQVPKYLTLLVVLVKILGATAPSTGSMVKYRLLFGGHVSLPFPRPTLRNPNFPFFLPFPLTMQSAKGGRPLLSYGWRFTFLRPQLVLDLPPCFSHVPFLMVVSTHLQTCFSQFLVWGHLYDTSVQ